MEKNVYLSGLKEHLILWHGILPEIDSKIKILGMIKIGILGNIGSGKSLHFQKFRFSCF